MSEQFRGAFAEEQLGIRTDRLPEVVLKAIGDSLDEPSREGLLTLLGSIGKKGAKASTAEEEEEDDEDKPKDKPKGGDAASDGAAATRTAHLLFLSRQEIEAVGSFARAKKEALTKVLNNKKKPDAKAIEKLRKELKEYLEEHTKKNAVDVGLFGRFVTSDEFDTVEGALQVAHALGTQKVEVEYDYFTAVDDLGEGPGAGQQRPEVVLQMHCVFVGGLSVHARRAVLASTPVCLAQPIEVDVMSQRRERLVAQLPRQHRYPFKSR
jgi:CRISPR system Cascade subunit CasC